MTKTNHTPGCVRWPGVIDNDGYGRLQFQGQWKAIHRLLYSWAYGPIEDGLTIDHLCRTRNCVNLAHMELVTIKENVLRGYGITAINARKIFCIRGHKLTGKRKNGGRFCRECTRQSWKAYRLRKIASGEWTRS